MIIDRKLHLVKQEQKRLRELQEKLEMKEQKRQQQTQKERKTPTNTNYDQRIKQFKDSVHAKKATKAK